MEESRVTKSTRLGKRCEKGITKGLKCSQLGEYNNCDASGLFTYFHMNGHSRVLWIYRFINRTITALVLSAIQNGEYLEIPL